MANTDLLAKQLQPTMHLLNVLRFAEHTQLCSGPYCGRAFAIDGDKKVRIHRQVAARPSGV